MSQNERILNYLKPPGRKLTRKKAYALFGTMSLNTRASNLRDMGHDVRSTMIYKKRNGKVVARWAEYYLA